MNKIRGDGFDVSWILRLQDAYLWGYRKEMEESWLEISKNLPKCKIMLSTPSAKTNPFWKEMQARSKDPKEQIYGGYK